MPLSNGDLIIDIGADIGEVSRLLAAAHGVIPIAIEPDLREFAALAKNLDGLNAETWNALLWSKKSQMPFFDGNDSGDSSVFAPRQGLESELRESTTLDHLLSQSAHRDKQIRLMKLEAEGAEPEVLLGATETLQRTEFVTADLGPERGASAETTLAPVYEILSGFGFRAIDAHNGRLVVLFQRQ